MKRLALLATIAALVALVAPLALAAGIAQVTVGTTLENLQAAYNGESNASAKYLEFSKQADKEGYAGVASLFRAASRAEQVHATKHATVIKSLGGTPTAKIEPAAVKSTKENLEAAIAGESYERDAMYPQFIGRARADRSKDAIESFNYAKTAEAEHAVLYADALEEPRRVEGQEDLLRLHHLRLHRDRSSQGQVRLLLRPEGQVRGGVLIGAGAPQRAAMFPPIPSFDGLHPIVVHFPVALLIVAPLFLALAALFPSKAGCFGRSALVLLALGTIASFVAVESGEAAARLADRTPEINAQIERHEELAEHDAKRFRGAYRRLRGGSLLAQAAAEGMGCRSAPAAERRRAGRRPWRRAAGGEHRSRRRRAGPRPRSPGDDRRGAGAGALREGRARHGATTAEHETGREADAFRPELSVPRRCRSAHTAMVAGAGFEPATFGL